MLLFLLFNTSSASVGTIYGHLEDVQQLEWSEDGQFIVSGGSGGKVIIWNFINKTILLEGMVDNHGINEAQWLTSGKTALALSSEGVLYGIYMETKNVSKFASFPKYVDSTMQVNGQKTMLSIATSDNELYIHKMEFQGTSISIDPVPYQFFNKVIDFSWSPTSSNLSLLHPNNTISIYHTIKHSISQILTLETSYDHIVWENSGLLIGVWNNLEVLIMDLNSQETVRTIHRPSNFGEISTLSWSNGTVVIIGSSRGHIQGFNYETDLEEFFLNNNDPDSNFEDEILSMDLSSKGFLAVGSTDFKIKIWDIHTKSIEATLGEIRLPESSDKALPFYWVPIILGVIFPIIFRRTSQKNIREID